MPGYFNWRQHDYDGESGTCRIPIYTLTAANHDSVVANVLALKTALTNITLGEDYYHEIVAADTNLDESTPTDPYAQRERKWLVSLVSVAGGITPQVSVEIPTADLQYLSASSRPYMDVGAATPGESLVNAIEAFVTYPGLVTGVTVKRIMHVGRNL